MHKIFDIVPGWIWALVCVALLAWVSTERALRVNEIRAHSITKEQYADYRAKVSDREAVRSQHAMEASERNRETERFRNKAATEAQNEVIANVRREAATRAVRDERRRVFDAAVEAATARSPANGQSSGDPAALRRAEEAAATVGNLLKSCRNEADGDAEELEALAAQVRGLIRQYESLLAPSPADTLQTPPHTSGTPAPAGAPPLRSTTTVIPPGPAPKP